MNKLLTCILFLTFSFANSSQATPSLDKMPKANLGNRIDKETNKAKKALRRDERKEKRSDKRDARRDRKKKRREIKKSCRAENMNSDDKKAAVRSLELPSTHH